jgi:hypothetical protein
MEIKMIKMVSGESVIASIEESDESIHIKKPVVIAQVMTEQGPGVGLRPWLLGSKFDQSVNIEKSHILCVAELDEDIYNVYQAEHGSGIVLGSHAQGRKLREVVDYGS